MYLTLFHFTTSVDRINNSIIDNDCVLVFMCFCIFVFENHSTSLHQWIQWIFQYLSMAVCLCLCVFHFSTSVDTTNNSIFDNGCVFVFVCFPLQYISGYNKLFNIWKWLCVFVFLYLTLFHLSTSVDTINYSVFENGCVFVFMCFCIFVFDIIPLHYISGYDK